MSETFVKLTPEQAAKLGPNTMGTTIWDPSNPKVPVFHAPVGKIPKTEDFNQAIMGARKKATAERTQQVIDAYVVEYERVNGRCPVVTENHGWITLDGHFRSKMRVSEMIKALDVLKGRANFVSTETATFNLIQTHPYVAKTIATTGSWK